MARDAYAGFRPTYMCEKLSELHGINLSKETVRKLMIQAGVWSAKSEKRPAVHQLRSRRARKGELVQIDGSPHGWFEDRGEPCSLLVYIDDATGRTYGKFAPTESSMTYMDIRCGRGADYSHSPPVRSRRAQLRQRAQDNILYHFPFPV